LAQTQIKQLQLTRNFSQKISCIKNKEELWSQPKLRSIICAEDTSNQESCLILACKRMGKEISATGYWEMYIHLVDGPNYLYLTHTKNTVNHLTKEECCMEHNTNEAISLRQQ
jgi:hypothetical protein